MTKTRHRLTLACLGEVPWVWEAPHGLPRDEMQSRMQSLMTREKGPSSETELLIRSTSW
jgi:hypothetical protein